MKFNLKSLEQFQSVLFNCISTPCGLAVVCDDVNIKKDVHIFFWDGSEESARMVSKKKDNLSSFVGLKLRKKTGYVLRTANPVDELTGENALVITDFADDEDEVEDAKDL